LCWSWTGGSFPGGGVVAGGARRGWRATAGAGCPAAAAQSYVALEERLESSRGECAMDRLTTERHPQRKVDAGHGSGAARTTLRRARSSTIRSNTHQVLQRTVDRPSDA
jgi:hypothetical protein